MEGGICMIMFRTGTECWRRVVGSMMFWSLTKWSVGRRELGNTQQDISITESKGNRTMRSEKIIAGSNSGTKPPRSQMHVGYGGH